MNFIPCEKAGLVEGFGLIRSCDKKSAKNGSTYLDIVLCDADSEIYAKLWDYREDVIPLPQVNTVIKFRGTLQQYNGNDQLIIQRIRPAVESDNISITDFVKSSDCDEQEMYDVIVAVASSFEDEDIKNVVLQLLEENKAKLLSLPAAEKLHHAMRGGLLYHTLSIVRLAEFVCKIYSCVDRDLLLAGAILHDIAKIREYTVDSNGLVDGHSLEGALLGHLVMGAEEVGKMCDKLSVDEEKKYLLQHMLISHHGKLEFGAAVRPSFIEAELLSQLDLMDANVYEMADALKDVEKGGFTGRLWMLDNRKLYNHGRKAVEPHANIIEKF